MFQFTEDGAVRLAIRELCERSYAEGDLDLRPGTARGVFLAEESAAGMRAHRLARERGGEAYNAEVPLSCEIAYGGERFLLSGRADGVIRNADGVTVDEVKSIRTNADVPHAPNEAHAAQAVCYAYCLCKAEQLPCVTVRIRYFCADTERQRAFACCYTEEMLCAEVHALLARILRTVKSEREHACALRPSLQRLTFPFEKPREGQLELMRSVVSTIRHRGRLFVQAPTGIGKTMSVLYPSLKAMGEGFCKKIFYLTAKATTRAAAMDAAARIFAEGAALRAVVITAREKCCLHEKRHEAASGNLCNPRMCPYARGYYARAAEAVCMLLERESLLTREVITAFAKEHRLCPYEFSLDLAEQCDLIVCDYNYLFHPRIRFRRFFGTEEAGVSGDYVFLVDEAHNLLDRAREIFSAALTRTAFCRVGEMLPEESAELRRLFPPMLAAFEPLYALCAEHEEVVEGVGCCGYSDSLEPDPAFVGAVEAFCDGVEREVYAHRTTLPEELLDLWHDARAFVDAATRADKRFRFYLERCGDEMTCRILCLAPAHELDRAMALGRASVLFSGTLTPPTYFSEVLGGGSSAQTLELPSPYDPSHLCVSVCGDVSTRLGDRAESADKIAKLLAAAVSVKCGNYLVYLPSYAYLSAVSEAFRRAAPTVRVLEQKQGAPEQSRRMFLAAFSKPPEEGSQVGFCVLGGVYGEGIDLVGEQLIGVAVVGVGLPSLSAERNFLRDYYAEEYEMGYEYAYVYPGMNKVLQAAGRVIRSESDRGIVLLIDDRFAESSYTQLFPAYWKQVHCVSGAAALRAHLREFWEKPQP